MEGSRIQWDCRAGERRVRSWEPERSEVVAREQVIKFIARRLCRDILVQPPLRCRNFIKKKKIHSCFKVCSVSRGGGSLLFSWKDLVPYSFIQTKVSLPENSMLVLVLSALWSNPKWIRLNKSVLPSVL